jgi:hypothetical protein
MVYFSPSEEKPTIWLYYGWLRNSDWYVFGDVLFLVTFSYWWRFVSLCYVKWCFVRVLPHIHTMIKHVGPWTQTALTWPVAYDVWDANFQQLQPHATSQLSHLAWCLPHPFLCYPWIRHPLIPHISAIRHFRTVPFQHTRSAVSGKLYHEITYIENKKFLQKIILYIYNNNK